MMRSRYWLVVSTVPCLFSFAAGAEMVVEKPGDERRLGHPVGQAALFNLVQGLSPATKSAFPGTGRISATPSRTSPLSCARSSTRSTRMHIGRFRDICCRNVWQGGIGSAWRSPNLFR